MTSWSNVERNFLERSERQESYAGELISCIEVQNVYELGKLTTLSFLEWVLENPTGVIALPTGRTPEYFIKTLEMYRSSWKSEETKTELIAHGFPYTSEFPDTSRLTFVMLDEFFPILPTHRNSFCNYIRTFYLPLLNINPQNVFTFDLLEQNVLTSEEFNRFKDIDVDLTLLTRDSSTLTESECENKLILQKVQSFCDSFEARIQARGGIGFFLGGIGPDGHIAFNQEGSPHDCRTRLVNFNYPTAAAAASDLGGIEIARGKAAMTIGLSTITFNPQARIVIMAAGEGKASVVRAAVEMGPDPERPASVLQGKAGGRFYLTHGAASLLTARKAEMISRIKDSQTLSWALRHLALIDIQDRGNTEPHLVEPSSDYSTLETLIYNLSLRTGKPVHELQVSDLPSLPEAQSTPEWMRNEMAFSIMVACAARRLREKVEGGLAAASVQQQRILHTGPHHDDIMLSYHGAMHEFLGRQEAGKPFHGDFQAMLTGSGLSAGSGFLPLSRNRSLSGCATTTSNPTSDGSFESLSRTATAYSSSPSTPSFLSQQMHSSSAPLLSRTTRFRLGESFNGNLNYFAYLTSGFHSVNDSFLKTHAEKIRGEDGSFTLLNQMVADGELNRDYDDLMAEFHQAFITRDEEAQTHVETAIFLRKVAEVWGIVTTQSYSLLTQDLRSRIAWFLDDFLTKHQPGDALPKEIQLLKGCMRESEVDRVWALSRMPMNRIHHMRSKFYNDDFFTPMPNIEDDALPMANLIRTRQPDILTVAFDPEGTGPDTHYKVLQVVAAGLRIAKQRGDMENSDPIIWGYRNVWFVFTPADATLMIPCTGSDLDLMHDTFMACFTTQKNASFPSPHYDGPFSAWARHLQKQQKQILHTLLGQEYFQNHRDFRIRNCEGFVFLKAMHASHFLREVEELKEKFENICK